MTHARITPNTLTDLRLSDLDAITRALVEDAFEDARLAVNCTEYALAQHAIAARLGIAPSGELALCTCDCGCDRIEDARHVATYQPGNGREIAQCRDCADTHRYTD